MKQTNKKKQHAISFNYGKKRASAKLYLRRYQSMVNNTLEEPWCDMSSFSYLPSSHYRRGRSLQFTWCSQESCAHSNNKPTHELPISASNQACLLNMQEAAATLKHLDNIFYCWMGLQCSPQKCCSSATNMRCAATQTGKALPDTSVVLSPGEGNLVRSVLLELQRWQILRENG